MKRSLLILSLLVHAALVLAQDSTFVARHLFTKDHITLSIGGVLRAPGVAIPRAPYDYDDPIPKSFWGAGLRLDINYTFHLGRRSGFEAGFAATGYKEAYSIMGDDNWRSALMFAIPNWHSESRIRVFQRLRLHPKIWIQASYGVSLVNYRRCYCSDGITMQDGTRGYILNNTGVDITHYLHTTPGFAFLFLLPNEDMLRIGFTGNLVADGKFFKISYGSYQYQDAQGQILSRGSYDIRGNYISMDIGYTFTRTRELRRNMEAVQSVKNAKRKVIAPTE